MTRGHRHVGLIAGIACCVAAATLAARPAPPTTRPAATRPAATRPATERAQTPAELAREFVMIGDCTRLKALLDRVPMKQLDIDPDVPLMALAVQYAYRDDSVIKLLRERGARMDLYAAAGLGDAAFVRAWLAAGKPVRRTREHWPTHAAASRGQAETLKLLIDARVSIGGNDYDATPLHDAASHGHRACVDLLLDAGADVNAVEKFRGQTPLFKAHDAAMALHLIERGAKTDVLDRAGWRPIDWSAFYGELDVLKALVAREPSAEVKGRALVVAVGGWEQYRFSTVRILIAAGADVNARGEYGRTPLLEAIGIRNVTLVKVLLAAGADPTLPDAKGQTPVEFAMELKAYNCAAVLREAKP